MITVHHLNNSRSQRILWLLEELNAYNVEIIFKNMSATNSQNRKEVIEYLQNKGNIRIKYRTFNN